MELARLVQNNRVAQSIGEGALTAGVGDAVESGATVSGNRTAGDVDGTGVAASGVVVGDNDLLGLSGLAQVNVSDWVMFGGVSVPVIRLTSPAPYSGTSNFLTPWVTRWKEGLTERIT